MIVISGPASTRLAERIAAEMGVDSLPVEHRIFPDGESYIRLAGSLEEEVAVIVQTTSPPQDNRLMQLFMMAITASNLGAEKVICVVPYLAYARQDKRFLEGETLSLEIVIRLLDSAGVDELIVIDAHNARSLEDIQRRYRINVVNLSAITSLSEYLRDEGYGGAFSLAPDKGAVGLAELGSVVLGDGFGFFEKQRDRRTGNIEMDVKDLDLEGRDAVVFDDIISSGGTMSLAVAGLRRQGVNRIAAACTHALFRGEAEKKIRDAGANNIIATDTVETKFSRVSVSKIIAQHLKKFIY